jgi:hypothetical protein
MPRRKEKISKLISISIYQQETDIYQFLSAALSPDVTIELFSCSAIRSNLIDRKKATRKKT